MKNDVILNKISIIERCLKRIDEEYDHDPKIYRFTNEKAHAL
ncbi:hypothetical protein BRO54_0428 [Geobacillus proteiniphilus]|uniref:Uncharacterized protein n=1 Tax=Geobacillus proteiniphilus TaxID=860353 RepID=A0A1Q5T7N5_9BACL|nr:hypothetical protein BRO54_0428 [Geobacillus proteiniphilus]